MSETKYEGMTFSCPECGAKVTVHNGIAFCTHCGWNVDEEELEF